MAKKDAIEQIEIEAPYELPEGWKWCRLGEVADWGSGGTPSRKNPEYYNGSIPWIKTGELNESYIFDSEEKISEEAINHSSAKLFPKKTVVLAMYGATIGKTAIFGIDASTNQACACAICHKDLDNHYLFNFLKSKKDYFIYNAKGGAQPNISQEIIKDTIIPLPPTLAEQQRIVNRIETMFAKLDQAQDKAQTVLDSFETRKAAILHKAFTGQLRIENEELAIADWEDTTIGECCKLGSGGTPLKSHPEYYENGDIPWLKTGEIDWNDICEVEEKITKDGVENSSAKIYPAESVVVAMYGMGVTRGKAAIIKIPTATNQAVCVLQPNEKLNNRFLFYYFMCNYWQIREQSVGGNQLNLSGKIIASFSIKLPPLNYQLSIVNFLDTVLEKESRAKEAAQTVLDQIALLKKSILARAFRGEL